jgi:hypothetical protein
MSAMKLNHAADTKKSSKERYSNIFGRDRFTFDKTILKKGAVDQSAVRQTNDGVDARCFAGGRPYYATISVHYNRGR